MTTQLNEEKAAAANYVLQFYADVQNVTHNYANYENLMLELSEKYNGKDDKITQSENDQIKIYCQTIRYFVTVSFIKYSSIILKTGGKIDPKIEKLYNTIKISFVVKREDVKNYVLELNGVLMQTVIKTLLQSSDEIVEKLYGGKE